MLLPLREHFLLAFKDSIFGTFRVYFVVEWQNPTLEKDRIVSRQQEGTQCGKTRKN